MIKSFITSGPGPVAVHSLLLLVHCCRPHFVRGFCILSWFCDAGFCVLHLAEEERVGCLKLIVFFFIT